MTFWIPSTIPNPALKIGTITTSLAKTLAFVLAIGVSTTISLVSKSLVTSYVTKEPISLTFSLKVLVSVNLSRIMLILCWIKG